jgi:RHS repeat-associated protein
VIPIVYGSGSFGFGYDALSRRTSLTRPNTVNTSYGYDNLSHLLSVVHQKGTTTLDGASYTVDNAGNRQSRTALPGTTATNFTYDAIYELLTAKQGATTKESYTYDPVGNRLSNLTSSGWSNNASNELTSRPGFTYTYDNNGNMLTSVSGTNTTHYTWDFENRLTSMQLPGSGGTVTFKYDPFGRRVEKVSPSATSIYAYDGDNLIEETNAAGTAAARYIQTQNIDEPLAILRGTTTDFYEADGLGSVTSLTNSSGASAETYTYDSFGNLTASTGSLTNSLRYTGREFDSETNLYYYRARYYGPAIGRFISEDPLRLTGDANLYAYVDNDPVNALDPMGLCKIYVKFNKVIKGLPGYHAYIVTVDPSGLMMGFRGGPNQDGNVGGFYGPYDKTFPDYNPNKTPCKKVLDDNQPCRQYNLRLEQVLDDITAQNIPYPWYPFFPWSKNSNSVASQALFSTGLPVPDPPVWAPGWGTPLFPFANGGVNSGPLGVVGGGGGAPF